MDNQATLLPIQALRWRCRRGMRELDVLVGRWLDLFHAEAPDALKFEFQSLLDCEDDVIWDWMMGRAEPPERLAEIVNHIRERSDQLALR
ncbi:MAG: FAD assembly factor SdhE [Wenzhouxiangella sp.]